jgi:hypothetical protein
MRLVDALLGPVDEWIASRLISSWREAVWNGAAEMLNCVLREEREALRTQIEAAALQRAQTILIGRAPVA